MRWYLLIVALLSGCSGELAPGQDEAVEIVWFGEYHMTAPPPTLHWRMPETLDCDPHPTTGQMRGFHMPESDFCYGGWFRASEFAAEVAILEPGKFSNTSLDHELMHAAIRVRCDAIADRTICYDGDGRHVGPEWKYMGESHRARLALIEAGL